MRRERNYFLKAVHINTPLGPMTAIADERGVYLLEFTDRKDLIRKIEALQHTMRSTILFESTSLLLSLEQELNQYFNQRLTIFTTPLHFLGSSFQIQVWETLQNIPFGETRSYTDIAHAMGKKTACRAVACANRTNSLAIIVPCHRVIYRGGSLGGYAGGVFRKQWLLTHEQ